MADEQPKPPSDVKPARATRLAPILIVAALMVAEGVAIFALARIISPAPVAAMAESDEHGESGASKEAGANLAEIALAECRPSNKVAGKFVSFHVRVSALVDKENLERVTAMVESKKATLEDAVNVVIRSAEPVHFNEPGLETIRRRLKHEFGRVFHDEELIRQVLIPQFLQSGSGV